MSEEVSFVCRIVHVTVPTSGTLVLDAIADDPANTFWLSIGDLEPISEGHSLIDIDRHSDNGRC
jgi:hypothetical protein